MQLNAIAKQLNAFLRMLFFIATELSVTLKRKSKLCLCIFPSNVVWLIMYAKYFIELSLVIELLRPTALQHLLLIIHMLRLFTDEV